MLRCSYVAAVEAKYLRTFVSFQERKGLKETLDSVKGRGFGSWFVL